MSKGGREKEGRRVGGGFVIYNMHSRYKIIHV
jgi:hypothetical protein